MLPLADSTALAVRRPADIFNSLGLAPPECLSAAHLDHAFRNKDFSKLAPPRQAKAAKVAGCLMYAPP